MNSSKRRIEARWGLPFWTLVKDFAEQGLTRFDTARALGYRPDSFCSMLAAHPKKDLRFPLPPANLSRSVRYFANPLLF